MIKVKDLTIKFNDKIAVDNLSMEFEKGAFSCIIGPNGCGKSTTIKAIAGLIKPNNGQILIADKKRNSYPKKELGKKIAFLMQFKNCNHDFTVKEIVSYGRQPYLKSFKSLSAHDYEIIEWAMIHCKIKHLENEKVAKLSGGESQRVYLALALAQEPEVLILDEPTNHLDLKYQYEILNLVKALNEKKKITVICVLHDLNHACRFADKIFVMNQGRLVKCDQAKLCLNPNLIEDVYDIKTNIFEKNGQQYIEVL